MNPNVEKLQFSNPSKENIKRCRESRIFCQQMVRKSKMSMSNIKNITWWDNQIKQEISSMKKTELTYKELVMKRRLERRSFHQSLSYLLLARDTSSKSMQRLSNISGLYPSDLASTYKKFTKLPENNARIWRNRQKRYSVNPIDTFDKMEKEMRSSINEFYTAKVDDNNKNINELLNKLFSTEVDPMSMSSTVKIVSKLRKIVPDITSKYLGKSKMTRNEMITKLIHRDIKSLARKHRTLAFGSKISEPRSKPNKYDFTTKYLNMGHKHESLETFKYVWEDILELETTRKFCAWLMKNDHIEPPIYLTQKGGLKMRSKSKEKSDDLLFKHLEGFNTQFSEPIEIYDLLSKHISHYSDPSLSTLWSSSSSLHSLDISDINIII